VGINSQEASALIVVTQHYDTLQAIGSDANSNLILLPNSPQAGSDMLNNMVASFSASNQVGEMMKRNNPKKLKPKDGTAQTRNTFSEVLKILKIQTSPFNKKEAYRLFFILNTVFYFPSGIWRSVP
jgi:hypothetical protein